MVGYVERVHLEPELLNRQLCGRTVDDILSLEAKAYDAFQNEDYSEAISHHERLRRCSERELFDHELYNLVVSYKMTENFAQAKKVAQEAVDNRESSMYDDLAYLQIATILYIEGEIDEARERFAKIRKECPRLVAEYLHDPTFIGLQGLVEQEFQEG